MCFCLLSTTDKVKLVIADFGNASRLGDIRDSDMPQMLCGRILPIEPSLVAPVTGKVCVYYEAIIEELVERSDDNGLSGTPDPEYPGKMWIELYRHAEHADFSLVDPDFPSNSVYVPGSRIQVKMVAQEDIEEFGSSDQLKRFVIAHNPDHLPDHLMVKSFTVN